MSYVITQNCCKDASCVPVCPVDCIRPAGGPGAPAGTEMLYIDPETCIDCGACFEECPVDAIHYEEELPPELERFKQINAEYFEQYPLQPRPDSRGGAHKPNLHCGLRVAIVGTGPAACYAAAELVAVEGVEVDLFDRLPTPFGLVRAGVAPDHQHTKSIVDTFAHTFKNKHVGCHLNVEIGPQLTHEDLLAHHHAVIYAVGASTSRELGVPGDQLPGSHAAADFVGWYNGHPDHAGRVFDLSGQRAVIVGNGNVALDVARVLLMDQAALTQTDVAQHALVALADSNIEEVVILGRRGPRESAFSAGEFLALGHLPGIDVVIEGAELEPDPDDDFETRLKLEIVREYAERPTTVGHKRIVFRYLASPTRLVGTDHVEAMQIVPNSLDDNGALVPGDPDIAAEQIETSLVLSSIGYRGRPLPGLPFDPVNAIVPNDHGRVVDSEGQPITGVYVTGWIKRGPKGVIGTNRSCAQETTDQLWADYADGKLNRTVAGRDALLGLMAERGIDPIDWSAWRAIDTAEQKHGAELSRPRVKFVTIDDAMAAART